MHFAIRSSLTSIVLAGLLVLGLAPGASAATITLSAVETGFYDSVGQSLSAGQWFVGTSQNREYHDYFVFNLSGITDTIVGAVLQAYNPSTATGDLGNGYVSPDPTETMALWNVTSTAATVTGHLGGLTVYDDLGGGTQYASRTVSAADNGTLVSFTLNAAALADLDAATGLFVIGGSLTTLSGLNPQQAFFGFTALDSRIVTNQTRQLVLTTQESVPPPPTTVPEPATIWLVGLGAAGLASRRFLRATRGS